MKKKSTKKMLSKVLSGTLAVGMVLTSGVPAFAEEEAVVDTDATGATYYTSDYSSRQAVLDAGNKLSREIAGEGMVLLKNTENSLPITKGSKVTVLGKNSVNPAYSGGGSGNGALGAGGDPTDLYEALTQTGFAVNPVMKAFYEDTDASGAVRATGSPWGMIGRTIGYSTFETPTSAYGEEQMDSMKDYNDVALVYITRICSEGSDLPRSSWKVTQAENWEGNMADDYSSGHAIVDENGDPIPVDGRSDGSQHYLELDDNEKDMIEMAKQNFDKVVVVLNSGNPMECGEMQADEGVDAIIWAGNPGGTGFLGLCDILTGEVNPSGHLTDTWASDFTKSPTYNNFSQGPTTSTDYDSTAKLVGEPGSDDAYFDFGSGNAFYVDGDTEFTIGNNTYLGEDGLTYSYNRYVKYKEGIYVGYKYYETMAAMIDEAAGEGAGDAWYDSTVVYPFGYGLSYTTFDWNVDSSEMDLSDPNATSTVKVTVTNTGDTAGKDVVQLYASQPYEEGDPEKSEVVLAAYAKTELLQPGESETVELTFDAYDLASWDDDYAHDDTKGAYVLNDGTYSFTLRTDSHNVKEGTDEIDVDLAEDSYITTDPSTGALLQSEMAVASEIINGTELTTLTRADMKNGSTAEEIEDYVLNTALGRDSDDVRHINQEQLEELYKNVYFKETYTTAEEIDAYDSDKEYFQTETPKYSAGNVKEDGTPYMFSDLIGVDPTTEEGAQLYQLVVENASIEELATTIINGSHRITGIESIGMPGQLQEDGPGGFNTQSDSMAFCNNIVIGSTWNTKLAEEMGTIMGEVALWENIGGWYAPSVNIHRNEFGGRNFEYFSEDASLSGDMVAAQIKGASAKGLMCTLKHFALNEQDTDRGRSNDGVLTYADEQVIRELYLKPFEMTVKEGDATCLMGSFNRIGNYWSSSIRELNVNILRGEWGFVGAMITDANSGSFMQADNNIRGGVDWDLTNAGRLDVTVFVDENTGEVSATDTTIYLMQEAVKHIMYATTKSNAINEALGYIAEDGNMHVTDKLEEVTDPAGTHTRLNYIPLNLAD